MAGEPAHASKLGGFSFASPSFQAEPLVDCVPPQSRGKSAACGPLA
jgi:hypothetical protein